MTETPATHRARLLVQFPGWTIHRVEPDRGTGWTAMPLKGRRMLWGRDLGELETALWDACSRGTGARMSR